MPTRDKVHRNISCSCPPGSMAGTRSGNAGVRQVASQHFMLVPAGKYGGREEGQC